VDARLPVEFLDQRRCEIQQRDRDRIVGGDSDFREIDRGRAIQVRELREFLRRHRSVRQFDLRDEAPRQAQLLGHGRLTQAAVLARLAQVGGERLAPLRPRQQVVGMRRQTTPLRDRLFAHRIACESVGRTLHRLFISWHVDLGS
jgi:hypothetical protein